MSNRTRKYTDEENHIILKCIEDLCKELNRIPKNKELFNMKIVSNLNSINKYCKKLGFKSLHEYLRSKGFKTSLDLVLNNKIISIKDVSLNDLYELVQIYVDKNNHYPTVIDFNNSNNLPCWETASKLLKKNNISIKEFFEEPDDINRKRTARAQVEFYDKYVDIFKQEFIKNGYINGDDLRNNNLGIPTPQWLVNHCPDKKVKTYNQFIEWCGFKPNVNISKQKAIEIIYEMQLKLTRPICAEDFKNPQEGELGIRTVRRIWGETHIMQKELGLQITGKHADKYTKEEIVKLLDDFLNQILEKENRNIITYKDLRSYIPLDIKTYSRYLDCPIREYLLNKGFDMPNEGNGLNYIFKDGEKVRSQPELEFSNYIRNILKLQYNIDYFRDVKYKTFTQCSKNSNCDYVIDYKGRKIYIEVVGILKPEKKTTFRTDIYNSKSKEKYRRNLVDKENMFINAGLEYYILFTCDLNDEYLSKIFN